MTQTQGRWAFDVEEWKPITDFEDRYEISSFGTIKSISFLKTSNNANGHYSFFTKEKILKQFENVDHYLSVDLRKNKTRKTTSVHKLVAEHFLLNPNSYPQINHIDGNKQNNHASNLEWCTAKHNVIHSYKLGLASNKEERHPFTVLDHEKVFCIAQMRYKGCSYKEISEELGLKYDTVWSVINKRNWVDSYTKAIEVIENGNQG